MPLEEQLDEARSKVETALKMAMIKKGFKQNELAKMLHISRAAMSRAVTGDANPQSRKIRKKLYKILGIGSEEE